MNDSLVFSKKRKKRAHFVWCFQKRIWYSYCANAYSAVLYSSLSHGCIRFHFVACHFLFLCLSVFFRFSHIILNVDFIRSTSLKARICIIRTSLSLTIEWCGCSYEPPRHLRDMKIALEGRATFYSRHD